MGDLGESLVIGCVPVGYDCFCVHLNDSVRFFCWWWRRRSLLLLLLFMLLVSFWAWGVGGSVGEGYSFQSSGFGLLFLVVACCPVGGYGHGN